MTNSDEKQIVYVQAKRPGMVMGIIAVILAILGFLTFAILFVPFAIIFAAIGLIVAIKNANGAAIGVNILAWILIIIDFVVSPSLWVLIGMSASL